MAYKLVGKPDCQVTFPVQGTKAKSTKFNLLIKKFNAKPDVVDLMRKLEPFPRGAGIAIVGLHDIDIVDKHRLLIPIGQIIASSSLNTTIIRGTTITLLPS